MIESSPCRNDLGPNQACTVYGATPGETVIAGSTYIKAAYDLDPADLWRRSFLVLVGFFFLFQITQIVVLEYFPVSRHPVHSTVACILL